MSDLYTCGTWTVVAGREDDFAAAWQDLAEWTLAEIPGARWAQLVQDTEKPSVFLSFGPWESADAIAAWRESAGFQERVGRIRQMLEGFEPATYRLRASVGQ
jgi:heme-degrading monooxygenase HmoA